MDWQIVQLGVIVAYIFENFCEYEVGGIFVMIFAFSA